MQSRRFPHAPSHSDLLRSFSCTGLLALSALPSVAQLRPASQPTVSGTVTDPSGALIPGAHLRITLRPQSSAQSSGAPPPQDVLSDAAGRFTLTLAPGTYDLTATADGFNPLSQTVTVENRPLALALRLSIATTLDQVDVQSDAASSTAAADNKGALVFKADDLATLSSNDNSLQQQVLAMAGGSGEGGGSVYVDGFSNGRFPPKDTIREIRINQNPFSSQYPDLGLGRIEIFTKPGSEKLHGEVSSFSTWNAVNSRNPYTGAQPPYFLSFDRGSVSGPLGKKTSAFLSGQLADQQTNSVVNAFNPDGTRLSIAVAAPTTEYTLAARIDRQLNPSNTLVSRYEYSSTSSSNTGVGLLVLPSQGSSNSTTTHTFQIGNTQLIGPNLVSETRFQYLRTNLGQTPNSTAPTINVQGAFSGGGSPTQSSSDASDQYEFQEYLSLSHGTHFIRFGARYRLLHETNVSTSNYNGSFTFASLAAFQANTPSFFSLTAGQTTASVLTGDLGAYAEDEWKARKNLTIIYGLRFETQSAIPDHFNPAPRAGLAWAVHQTDKHPPLVLLRASAGIFYQRFANGNILTSIRQNGTSQQAFLINNPTFYPNIPNPAQLSGTAPTPYRINPHLHVASEIIGSLSAERTLGKLGNVTATYYAVRGVHQYNSENINAPLPNGTRPLGGNGDLYQFSSDGIEKAQSLNINTNLHYKGLSVFGFYSARRQNSDTFGAASFPSQPYNVSADYGPSGLGFQPIAQRLFAGVNDEKLPFGFDAGAFLGFASRSRFNITTGTDRNGDTQFNDRPAFATAPGPTSVLFRTPYGTFDSNPQPGEPLIPINYAPGPRLAFFEMDLGRTFKFGPRPAPPAGAAAAPAPKNGKPAPRPDPRYALSFNVDAINLLNTNNAGTPVGVLTSPFFNQSLSTNSFFGISNAGNRFIFFGANFSF